MLWFIEFIKNKTAFLLCVFLFLFNVNVYADNVYVPLIAEIPVSFSVTGSSEAAFEALIEAKDNSPQPLSDTVTVYGSNSGEFKIQLTEPGTYKYVVCQKKGSEDKITYDTRIYDVTVFAEASQSGSDSTLDYAITTVASGARGKADEIIFLNTVEEQTVGSGGGSGSGRGSYRAYTDDLPPKEKIKIPSDTDTSDTAPPLSEVPQISEAGTDRQEADRDIASEYPNGDIAQDYTDNPNNTTVKNDTHGDAEFTETTSVTTSQTGTVETGDRSNRELALLLMLTSLAVIVLSAVAERKKRSKCGIN